MYRLPILTSCAAALVMTALSAQTGTQVVIPKAFAGGGDARTLVPLSEQPMRYQQTFSAAVMKEQIPGPVRLRGIAFRSKASAQASVQIELDVTISTFSGAVLNGIFSRNLQTDATVVVPKQKITLPVSTAGWDLNLPFTRDWTWDGESAVILDVRLYGNGNQNRQFFYWWDSIAPNVNTGVNAHYALGANASRATTSFAGRGLVTRFEFQDGVVLGYGAGCKGLGGYTPEISALGLPSVGNQGFRINLQKARPNTAAILMWGSSATQWGAIKLPFDLVNIGIPNCKLYAEPLDLIAVGTVGGSPGTGIGSAPFPIPPSGIFIGFNLYMQWGVVDDSNNAALDLVFSDAMRVVIGG